jgi:hypothetical protein
MLSGEEKGIIEQPKVPEAPAPEKTMEEKAAPVDKIKALFNRPMLQQPKYFIPESLFPEGSTVKEDIAAPAPAKKEALPGENDILPKTPPKIDLPEVINSLGNEAEPVATTTAPQQNSPLQPLPDLPVPTPPPATDNSKSIPSLPGINPPVH